MYRDPVNFKESKMIRSIRYDHDAHELEINFYEAPTKVYKGVPSEKVAEFEEYIDKPGAGEWYQGHIKGIFETK